MLAPPWGCRCTYPTAVNGAPFNENLCPEACTKPVGNGPLGVELGGVEEGTEDGTDVGGGVWTVVIGDDTVVGPGTHWK